MPKAQDDSRSRLITAAELLMREDGYAAVTSRRVASKAGLKPQLVHYYFKTMDDLFFAVLERGAAENSERLTRALSSTTPLQSFWDLCSDTRTAAISAEFLALANHRKNIRARVTQCAEKFRSMQTVALTKILRSAGIKRTAFPPGSLAFIMESIARVLVAEQGLGMSRGHAQTIKLVRRYLLDIERSRSREQT